LTRIQKRALYKKLVQTVVGVLAYVLVPLGLIVVFCPQHIAVVLLSYILILGIIVFLYRNLVIERIKWERKKAEAYEQIRMLQAELDQSARIEIAIQRRKNRYLALESMMQKLSYNLSLGGVAHYIVQKTLEMNPKADNCLVYIIDEEKQRLELVDYTGEDLGFYKPEKHGDVFDKWILRHNCPLLIEDTSQDYRFDLDAIGQSSPVGSLISVPLILDEKLIGILRVNSFDKYTFYSEDLSFLSAIADLSAVTIGNTILYKQMENLALHDGLTGLYLRRYILERLDEIFLYNKQKAFTLMMLDIDDFKLYNDRFGHTAGDIIIRSVAKILLRHTRKHKDVVCRYGGEEFLVYLEGKSKAKAMEIAEKIRQDIEARHVVLRRIETSVTVSIGIASYPKDGRTKTELIKKADDNLYKAKSLGKNRVCA